jgi:hypothetical protein
MPGAETPETNGTKIALVLGAQKLTEVLATLVKLSDGPHKHSPNGHPLVEVFANFSFG